MKKQIITILMLTFSVIFSVHSQNKVSGVLVEEKTSVNEKTLFLNGAGIRERMWIDLYVAALYLPQKSTSASEIISSKQESSIQLTIVSGLISSDKMINAVNEGFEKATNGNIEPFKDKIEKFKSFFKDEIKKKDVFLINYIPNKGIEVFKNGTKKGSIEGYDFKKVLFGIWLSNDPVDIDLKKDMLGL